MGDTESKSIRTEVFIEMISRNAIREDLVRTLDHVARIEQSVSNHVGGNAIFTFPDQHKIYEGLFLSAWTHWEEFLRSLLVHELATDAGGFVLKDITKFRIKGTPYRLAERILLHPDHPNRFVEWDYNLVKFRADQLLSAGHVFSATPPRASDLEILKRIRNAVAHKSDRARDSFLKLVLDQPFSLSPAQRRGISVGRFLAAHSWNNNRILVESVECLRQTALHLIP